MATPSTSALSLTGDASAHPIDVIDLSTIEANGSAAGNTAFKFLAAEGVAAVCLCFAHDWSARSVAL